jgi:hypothetical protein
MRFDERRKKENRREANENIENENERWLQNTERETVKSDALTLPPHSNLQARPAARAAQAAPPPPPPPPPPSRAAHRLVRAAARVAPKTERARETKSTFSPCINSISILNSAGFSSKRSLSEEKELANLRKAIQDVCTCVASPQGQCGCCSFCLHSFSFVLEPQGRDSPKEQGANRAR